MLEWFSDTSRRLAVFEDDGTSAWLYLTAAQTRKPIADIWIYNRIPAPHANEIAGYRGGPPPAAIGFADDSTICDAPHDYEWTLDWHLRGECVVLHRDRIAIAMLAASDRRGWCRNLLRNGPWGNVWSDDLYSERTQTGG